MSDRYLKHARRNSDAVLNCPACSDNVITMTFMNGFSLATFLSDHSSLAIDGTSLLHFANKLVEVYAYQIFELGIFHSDPHPGNILISSTGALTLLDFGQVKVLSSRTRENLARLVVALDQNSPLSGQLLDNMGVKVQNATASMKTAIAYVLFDTRMDIAEAKMNPFEANHCAISFTCCVSFFLSVRGVLERIFFRSCPWRNFVAYVDQIDRA